MPPAVPVLRGARATMRGRPIPIRIAERAPTKLRPGELARAQRKLEHACDGHRAMAAHHRAEAERAEDTEERETHARMAATHDAAAQDHESKRAALQ